MDSSLESYRIWGPWEKKTQKKNIKIILMEFKYIIITWVMLDRLLIHMRKEFLKQIKFP